MAVRASLGEDVDGPLIKGVPNGTFVNQPMGKSYLSSIGKDVAGVLKLDNPERYTGHCFRRTAATMAADGGATTQQMQKAFGWTSANTAQRYVDESRVGARSMANIMSSNTVKMTILNVAAGSGEPTEKTYHITVSGENNVIHFS